MKKIRQSIRKDLQFVVIPRNHNRKESFLFYKKEVGKR